jgi:hypothetical protein
LSFQFFAPETFFKTLSMSERQRERDPNHQQGAEHREQLLPAYHQAARYGDELASEEAYAAAQHAIYETPCNLSTYRLLLLPDAPWHVLALGDVPSAELQQQLIATLASGELIILPNDVLIALNTHRNAQPTTNGWVERHYLPRRRRSR